MYYPLNKIVFSPVVTTRCNLRCNHCGYGCTSKTSNLDADPDKLMESVSHLYKLFLNYKGDVVVQIGYLGGEPLLYKHLPILLDFMKSDCPSFNRDIVTNGIYAPYLKENVLDSLVNNYFQLDISKYPIEGYNYDKLLHFLKSCGVKSHIIETEMQHLEGVEQVPQTQSWFHEHFYSGEIKTPPFSNADDCRQVLKGMACTVIWNEYMFPCSNMFEVFNNQKSNGKYLDIPFSDLDMWKIKEIKSIEELIDRLHPLYPFCYYCHGGKLRKWSTDIKVKLI